MVDPVVLYHNPRCSKSRAALALLEEKGVNVEIVRYLDTPLDRAELEALGKRLGLPPSEWVRPGESDYEEAGLSPQSSDEAFWQALVSHPVLMQRPIAQRGDRAVIGRPPERVLDLL